MTQATEYRRSDAHDLYCQISRFRDDQKNDRSIEHRWLASYLEDVLKIVIQVKNGNLEPATREMANQFRLDEIAQEQQKRQTEIEILDREAARLKSKKA